MMVTALHGRLLHAQRSRQPVHRDRRNHCRLLPRAAIQVHQQVLTLKAVPISSKAFAPFGQLIEPTEDGKEFDEQDAQLRLDAGTPRFYIMRIPRRGLKFDSITYHAKVTQCLGCLGQQHWYLAVSQPTFSLEEYPKPENLTVFRIPAGVYVKMEPGTWHAGPLFNNTEHMDFYNLELSDTNTADYNTHKYAAQGVEFEIVDV